MCTTFRELAVFPKRLLVPQTMGEVQYDTGIRKFLNFLFDDIKFK